MAAITDKLSAVSYDQGIQSRECGATWHRAAFTRQGLVGRRRYSSVRLEQKAQSQRLGARWSCAQLKHFMRRLPGCDSLQKIGFGGEPCHEIVLVGESGVMSSDSEGHGDAVFFQKLDGMDCASARMIARAAFGIADVSIEPIRLTNHELKITRVFAQVVPKTSKARVRAGVSLCAKPCSQRSDARQMVHESMFPTVLRQMRKRLVGRLW